MDTITHVLFGAVCAAAVTRKESVPVNDYRMRLAVTGVAAAFPDIDYLSFWIDPLVFLADWHRTATHSLVLMPLWAAMLGSFWMLSCRARGQWLSVYALCGLGISSHILLDLLTVFGIRVFYPLSNTLYSFDTSFVIDAIVTFIFAVTLVYCLRRPGRGYALSGLLMFVLYVGTQWGLKTQAYAVAARQLPASSDLHALPQPFSPFYWQLIHRVGEDYQVAHLSLLANERAVITHYRGGDTLDWRHESLLGAQSAAAPLVHEVWTQPQFLKFREFARFPAFYRLDEGEGGTCVWFTDLRYTLPYLTPSFRYGMCREPEKAWALYRLKRFTHNERQPLPAAGLSPN
ncbi:MAG: metal-dependent hydrolase [Candidatus Thiodiazotropha sp. (ex Monitilora ramsayi)]|nr:metal-dependent hydrolase [Candidatus Thiodiazotropha sp. (ex Monitilora ramsayi)]